MNSSASTPGQKEMRFVPTPMHYTNAEYINFELDITNIFYEERKKLKQEKKYTSHKMGRVQ